MSDKVVGDHSFSLNSEIGGESLMLYTKHFWNGDDPKDGPSIYTNQSIVLQSYGNSASLNLFTASITPKILRQLADQLDEAMIVAEKKAQELHDASL
jgi:hypothetical protein